ncbi:MAG TPA: C25 family cysteine peptidase, partial [Candidatus Cloacimonadota bacterium]|nr:C25 family cysteine peptidase [Candidatus Cloacimonadota bacterium]
WVSFRQSQGFSIFFFDIATVLATSTGINNADKLRNFLIDFYDTNPFMYLLLVGDHDTVPVGMLIPEPDGADTIPSDFIYSDLSSDFDTDNDGRWGEYYSVTGEQDWGVDYTPEVFVGRISTNSPAAVSTIASRIVAFDSSTAAFKQKALLPAAFLNYNDEPEYGMPITDGAGFMELAKQTVLRNYQTTTLYEQIGVIPSYPSDYALDYTQLASLLSTQDYGIINWSAHGSATSSSRKVWIEDTDQDGIPGWGETEWMSMVNCTSFDYLNTAQGAVIFAASCYNGMIDYNSASLAEYALQKKGVAVFGATRTGWYKLGWQNPGWGGLSSYNYHLLENYADRQHSIGYAHAYANLLHTQYYLFGDPIDTGGIIWPELQNVYTYLLYGDPAVGHNASSFMQPLGEILVYDPDANDGFKVVNAIRENANFNVVYTNRLIPDYDYLSNFEAVFALLGYGAEASIPVSGSWEYNLLNDYLSAGGKMYLEGGINWDPQDSLLGKFGTHAPLD